MAIRVMPMTLAPTASTPISPELIPAQVRWGILRRTGMGFTTWRGTYSSGAGISMDPLRAVRRPTRVGRHMARFVCFDAAIGMAPRGAAARQTAPTTATQRSETKTLGSVPSCPKVSEPMERRLLVVLNREIFRGVQNGRNNQREP